MIGKVKGCGFGLFAVSPGGGGGGGGGVHRISSDKDDRMGAKIETQKHSQGFKQNPPKIPGLKFNPKHIPCRISEP